MVTLFFLLLLWCSSPPPFLAASGGFEEKIASRDGSDGSVRFIASEVVFVEDFNFENCTCEEIPKFVVENPCKVYSRTTKTWYELNIF